MTEFEGNTEQMIENETSNADSYKSFDQYLKSLGRMIYLNEKEVLHD